MILPAGRAFWSVSPSCLCVLVVRSLRPSPLLTPPPFRAILRPTKAVTERVRALAPPGIGGHRLQAPFGRGPQKFTPEPAGEREPWARL